MTTWSTAGSASLLAHGVHYAVTVGGIIGVLALLLPQMFERRRPAHATTELGTTDVMLWPPQAPPDNNATTLEGPTP